MLEENTDTILLEEIVGIRALMLNLFAKASEGPLSKEDLRKISEYADAVKQRKAEEVLARARGKAPGNRGTMIVNWRRFARSFPRWTTALLAGFIAVQCFFWWEWLAVELRPLERYYLPVYFHSVEDGKHAGARTRIAPLFKTAPSKKRELALTSDVLSGGDGNLPLQLSQSALEQGWMGY